MLLLLACESQTEALGRSQLYLLCLGRRLGFHRCASYQHHQIYISQLESKVVRVLIHVLLSPNSHYRELFYFKTTEQH